MTDWKALGADKKIVVGICAILLGWAGVHKFILGYTTEGIIQLVIGLLTQKKAAKSGSLLMFMILPYPAALTNSW